MPDAPTDGRGASGGLLRSLLGARAGGSLTGRVSARALLASNRIGRDIGGDAANRCDHALYPL